jgi:hypothetical protein
MNKIRQIIDFSIESFDKGVIFPIYGTCLGFESLLVSFFNYTIPIENYMKDLNVSLVKKTFYNY